MRVHHLNCATMCPIGGALISGDGPAKLVCHVLLIETDAHGLVLVDSGFGTDDVVAMFERHGSFVYLMRPVCDPRETALHQIEALGFDRADVRHLVLTHLDLDHAGGIPDFPDARVHVMRDEHRAAMRPRTLLERRRYSRAHFALDPDFHLYDARGEAWYGFPCVRGLYGLPPEVLLVPLAGHSRGHAAVAVDTGEGWLLHCGDAYFYRGEMDADRPSCPQGLALFQRIVEINGPERVANQRRLRELARDHSADVRLFCAHDAEELLARQQAAAAGRVGGDPVPVADQAP